MAKIVWLASYPKAGNTWLRFLLANLVYGQISSSSHLSTVVPDIHHGVNATHLYGDRVTFIKTHWQYDNKLPLREDTIAAIYIVRNPLQVVVSNLNYLILRQGDQYFRLSEPDRQRTRLAYIDGFIGSGGDQQWQQHGMGTLVENFTSWVDRVPYPVMLVRYEDLTIDPVGVISKLAKSLGIAGTREKMEAVVAASSFEALRRIEERESAEGGNGFFADPAWAQAQRKGHRFINQGKVDGYRSVLTAQQIAAATERFRPILDRAGYGLEAPASPTAALSARG